MTDRPAQRRALAGAIACLAALAILVVHAHDSGLYRQTLPPDPDLDVRLWVADRAGPADEVCILGHVLRRHPSGPDAASRIELSFPAGGEPGHAISDPRGVFILLLPQEALPSDRVHLTVRHPSGASVEAEIGVGPAPPPERTDSVEGKPGMAAAPLSIVVAHESGVPVPGVANRWVVLVATAAGRPAAADVTVSGLAREDLRLRTPESGWSVFAWDPASRGYAADGFSPGPIARVTATDAAGRTASAAFDPMRPRAGAPLWWRPDPERAARGADGPARFLLRVRKDPARPEFLDVTRAAPTPGGRLYLQGWSSGRMTFAEDFPDPAAAPALLRIPARSAGVLELRALRLLPDGECAFDRRFVRLDGPAPDLPTLRELDGSAPAVRFLSTAASGLEEWEASVADREEEYRAFHQGLLAALGLLALLALLGLAWVAPGFCLRLRLGRGVAWGYWAASLALVTSTTLAAARGWVPKPWRMSVFAAGFAVAAAAALVAYALAARHTRWAWAGFGLLGALALAVFLFFA